MRERLRRRATGAAQRAQAIGLGSKGIGEARFVQLEEHCTTVALPAVAAMDAPAADRRGVRNAEPGEVHPEVSRVFARFSRSSRMAMKARSNLLRHETLACSRSATRMRSRRDAAAAVTVALRCGSLAER